MRHVFGRPDDQKLVSSLTLFSAIAAGVGDEWSSIVTKADEILDVAGGQGLARCTVTQGFLAT